jgi:omega-6 fatty acid desaturase (delta-12 desaturase)
MRTSKDLILASKEFAKENRIRSWVETILTLCLLLISLSITFIELPSIIRFAFSIICALFYVRMFTIYHDYQHHAILQRSKPAELLMKAYGIFILTPQNIWKRSHDHHHNHNSKLTITAIGSYPTISKNRFLSLSKREQTIYLLNRHMLTVIFGHLTLFIYWLNLKSFIQSPKKHLDSLAALLLHSGSAIGVCYFFGLETFIFAWLIPFFFSFAMGSYLFYSQHNFPEAQFRENHDWKYEYAALTSTSFMTMHPVLHWMTGNIGYHHVHHLNSKIPFYRLPEAMAKMPELQNVFTTSWNPIQIWRCFQVKLWDTEKSKMITLRQAFNP